MCLFHKWSKWEDKVKKDFEHCISIGSETLVIGYKYIYIQERHCEKCNMKQIKDNSIYIARN